MNHFAINETTCFYKQQGENGPIILMLAMPDEEKISHVFDCIEEAVNVDCMLVALSVNDWDNDLSPWQMLHGDRFFCGNGKDLLDQIEKTILPCVLQKFGDRKIYITGYSLAGLFALWCCYNTNKFDGVACCSGSLWFSNWIDYACEHSIKTNKVYLSLGGKEEKVSDTIMSQIGVCTRKQLDLFKKQKINCILEMNPGGHFADSGKRIAKAIKWLIEEKE